MAQMLSRMERDGLIARTPDPNDGRSSLVSLTDLSRTRMPDAIDTLFAGNREALEGFSDEERQQFTALLVRLIGNLDPITNLDRVTGASQT